MTMDEPGIPEEIEAQLRKLTGYTHIEKIRKGFSFEQKYIVSAGSPAKFLVRIITPAEPHIIPRKKDEFRLIRRLRDYSRLIPRAHAFGTTHDGMGCFMVLDFIEGTDGETAMQGFSEADQYRLGIQAGRELKKLHAMPAPPGLSDWHDAILIKQSRKAAALDSEGLGLPGISREDLTEYIQDHESCVSGTPRFFLHDDYHPANMIVRNGDLAGIIDFNRCDWGDPVHDFVKLAYFSRAISIPFAAGQIDGYHGGPVPPAFWERYALYCAMTIISDVLWSHDYAKASGSEDEIRRSEMRIRMVLSDHAGFAEDVPRWYRDYAGKKVPGFSHDPFL